MNASVDALDLRLLSDYQHGFPLCRTPFARIAEELSWPEVEVIEAFARLRRDGLIARIGAVFAPRRIGASTLAAIRVPPARLAAVAEIVTGFAEVNHNYEREHDYNLWFVVTAGTAARVAAVLAAIESASALPVMRLPLEEEFHIDLGFGLACGADRPPGRARQPGPAAAPAGIDAGGWQLIGALEDGLPLCRRPFAALARRLQFDEGELLARIAGWLDSGILRRFGVVVRHHELGFTANAMVVHDIPDAAVGAVGRRLSAESAVTLCYRRPRVLPHWPYNLFCMIHGKEREQVEGEIAAIRQRHGLEAHACAVLFSRTRFKQQGARYADTAAA